MKQIIEETYLHGPFGHRGYEDEDERRVDMLLLMARGVNYFVQYHDTQSRFAIQYAVAGWVTRNSMLCEWSSYGIYDQKIQEAMHGPYQRKHMSTYVMR